MRNQVLGQASARAAAGQAANARRERKREPSVRARRPPAVSINTARGSEEPWACTTARPSTRNNMAANSSKYLSRMIVSLASTIPADGALCGKEIFQKANCTQTRRTGLRHLD